MSEAPWLLVRYKTPSEALCLVLFDKMKIEAYLPRTIATITHARTSKQVPRALFPGYMFIRDEGSYDRIDVQYLTGVVGLVRNGQQALARLHNSVIDKMRRAESPDGFIRVPDQPLRGKLQGVRNGDKLDVNIGGEWWVGKFVGMKGSDRVAVLLSLFGTCKEMVVGLHQVEKALR